MTLEQMRRAQVLQNYIKECKEFIISLTSVSPGKDVEANLQVCGRLSSNNASVRLWLVPEAREALLVAMRKELKRYEKEFEEL